MSEHPHDELTHRPAFDTARAWWRGIITGQEIGALLVLGAIVMLLAVGIDTFATKQNLRDVWLSSSVIAIAALGQTLVIITGGIDFSTSATMALAGLAAAYLISGNIDGQPSAWMIEKVVDGRIQAMGPDHFVPIALAAGPLAGLFIGAINGLLVAWVRVPAFIATLGMMMVVRGVTFGWSDNWPFQRLNDVFLRIGQNSLSLGGLDIPLPFILMLALALIMLVFLTQTVWGYRIHAVGGSEQAAALAGIDTRRVRLLVFALAGLMAGIAGTLTTARRGVAAPSAGQGYELDAIAAVLIGGTSIHGGRGRIVGTLIGAAITQVLRSGVHLLGLDPYWQPAVIGLAVLLAIAFERLRVWLQDPPHLLWMDELRARFER